MRCSACFAEVPEDDLFCEICGQALQPAKGPITSAAVPLCPCGAMADEVDEDGFCLCCGKRVRRPASDHVEQQISTSFAAVSDRGLQHDRNEDRFALVQEGKRYGLVLCDGVSSTSRSETASALVATTVSAALTSAFQSEGAFQSEEVLRGSIQTAAADLEEQSRAGSLGDAPSTTVVAAIVDGPEVTVAWAGDSRAYWVDCNGARLLTHDHSWVNEVLEAGQISAEEARSSPQAHAITRWIGADARAQAEPDVAHFTAEDEGTLVLCSDGLWNYAENETQLADLFAAPAGDERSALEIARSLVQFANGEGGRDNITVAVLRLLPNAMNKPWAGAEQTTVLLRTEDRKEPYAEPVQG